MNPRNLNFDASTLKTAFAGFVLICLLGIGLSIIARYRKMAREIEDTPANLLDSLRDAYDAGDLDSGEFRRVKDVLNHRAVELLQKTEEPDSGDSGNALIPPV